MMARNPLSWKTRWNGLPGAVCAAGIASSVPSFLSLMLNSASTLVASMPPYGFFQQRSTCDLNIAPQVAELSAALPWARPSAALEFSVSPVTACRLGSRLSSKAAILDWSKVRSGFGFGGCGGGVAAWTRGFGAGFFGSSFFKASAIGSTLGGSGFFSIGFGSSLGLLSATGFGGSGFFSGGFSTGLGAGSGAASVTMAFFSVTLPTASSTGLASATFSTSGFGFSFLPDFMPAVILFN